MMPPAKYRVLFVCVGNACRSQMAEAFARTYGSDVLVPASAGVSPAIGVAPDSIRAMKEKNIDLRDHFPKSLGHLGRAEFDIIINMTGSFLPKAFRGRLVDWEVEDPYFLDYQEHCRVRDAIETRVMNLVLELRNAPRTLFRGQGSGHLES